MSLQLTTLLFIIPCHSLARHAYFGAIVQTNILHATANCYVLTVTIIFLSSTLFGLDAMTKGGHFGHHQPGTLSLVSHTRNSGFQGSQRNRG